MYEFNTIKELMEVSDKERISIAEVVIRKEMEFSEKSFEEIVEKMRLNLTIMKEAIKEGLSKEIKSVSGLTGGEGITFEKYRTTKESLTGGIVAKSISYSLSVSGINAAYRDSFIGVKSW